LRAIFFEGGLTSELFVLTQKAEKIREQGSLLQTAKAAPPIIEELL
jgi:hypothetical protein